VARERDFQAFATTVARAALARRPETLDALLAVSLDGGKSIEETRRELIAKIGENIGVRRFALIEAPAVVGAYLHGTRIGALVAMKSGDEAVAKDIAMHVAAINPARVSAADVPADEVAGERTIFVEQAKSDPKTAGKPPDIVAKIVEGKVRKWLSEITLLGQPFVKDDKQSVEQYLRNAGGEVASIVRYEVGAGIEKKQEDFAEEVRKQVESMKSAPGAQPGR
jgi:elongation factor Ts